MKSDKNKIVILIVLILGFVFLPNIKLDFNLSQKPNDINPKQSASYFEKFICVDGNWSATTSYEWCYGDGSWSNPYIIENVSIDALNSLTGSGIYINNSKNDYFIIRNCKVYNAGSGAYDGGIKLDNSNNGTLTKNNCSNNARDGLILINTCENNTISENIVDNNYTGIYLEDESNNNTISGNTASDNVGGITLDNSNDNTISGNAACNSSSNGIYLHNTCTNNTISGNTANDNEIGMYIFNCNYNIITGNTVNNNVDLEGIVLDGSDNNIISGNNIDGNVVGIFIYNALNNTIIGNTISNNNVSGIHIDEDSDYNEFTENILRNNTIGLNINGLNENNSVYKNFFLNNEKHAFDNGIASKWNSTVIGNYWDNHTGPDVSPQDGIVDSPYVFIGGYVGSIDYLPIAEDGAPRINIISPPAGSRFGNTAPSFNIEVIDDYLFEMWYTIDRGLNNYTFTENGTINQSMWDAMSDGTITITFYALDVAGNIGTAEITVSKNLPEEFDPTLVIIIVSIVGGVALLVVILVILEKKGIISLEKVKELLTKRK
ncbi:MAG: nitrous oxide reductase family maturation protein NosD [Promethearchaeota archaeon]